MSSYLPNNIWKKDLILVGLLLLLGLLVGGCSQPNTNMDTNLCGNVVLENTECRYGNIDHGEAADLITANNDDESFVILDIRTPEEFNEGHVKDAININFYDENFESMISLMDKEKNYLIYCRSGKRSGKAFDIMNNLGFAMVYDLQGGLIGDRNRKLQLVTE